MNGETVSIISCPFRSYRCFLTQTAYGLLKDCLYYSIQPIIHSCMEFNYLCHGSSVRYFSNFLSTYEQQDKKNEIFSNA